MLPPMQRPAYLFMVCPDAALIRREALRLLAENGLAAGPADLAVYHADDPKALAESSFWRGLQSVSLLGPAKPVLLRRADKLDAKTWDQLWPVLASGPSGWCFLAVEAEWKRGQPSLPKTLTKTKAWARAQERGWVWTQPGLEGQGLPAYVRQGLAERGLQAPPPVLQALLRGLPAQAADVDNELDKLALAAGPGAELTPDHLQLLPEPPGLSFWDTITVLTEGGDPRALWREVLQADKDLLFKLLRNMERGLPTLALLAEGRDEAVKLPGWLKNKKAKLARKLSPAAVAKAYDLLVQAELGVKSGAVKEDQALERLVAGLTSVFGTIAGQGSGPQPPRFGGRHP